MTTFKSIAENDYILSSNTYSPYNGEEEVSHREPKEILKDISKIENRLQKSLQQIKSQHEK